MQKEFIDNQIEVPVKKSNKTLVIILITIIVFLIIASAIMILFVTIGKPHLLMTIVEDYNLYPHLQESGVGLND